MITYDCHIHSDFSTDSATPMIEQVKKAIALGLEGLCITDHMDYEFPKNQMDAEIIYNGNPFEFNWTEYKKVIHHLQSQYPDLDLLLGVACGLQTIPSVIKKNNELNEDTDLDYLIGSLHLTDGKDPYYAHFWEGKEPSLCIRRYLEQLYDNILLFSKMDALGHLDYIVRYAPASFSYSPMEFRDILEELLTYIIRKDIALEVNSSGLKHSSQPNPHIDILTLYRELGGQAVTIGSDAHKPAYISDSFSVIETALIQAGFKEYYTFHKRKAISHSL